MTADVRHHLHCAREWYSIGRVKTRFDALAAQWWDPSGPMAPLHAMNPLRAGWINRRILARPWGHYRCLDGFVSTLVLQPTHWINVAQWISEETGNDMFTEEAFRDLTVRAEINDLIDEWFEMVTVTKTKLEVFAEGQRRGVPVTPLNTIADLLSDPHLEATGFFDFAEHPVLGTYKRPGAPFRVNHSWWSLGRAPLLGEHTAEVLAEWG